MQLKYSCSKRQLRQFEVVFVDIQNMQGQLPKSNAKKNRTKSRSLWRLMERNQHKCELTWFAFMFTTCQNVFPHVLVDSTSFQAMTRLCKNQAGWPFWCPYRNVDFSTYNHAKCHQVRKAIIRHAFSERN